MWECVFFVLHGRVFFYYSLFGWIDSLFLSCTDGYSFTTLWIVLSFIFGCPVRTALREASRREAPLRTPPLRWKGWGFWVGRFFGFGNLVFQLWLTAGGVQGRRNTVDGWFGLIVGLCTDQSAVQEEFGCRLVWRERVFDGGGWVQ